MKELTRWSPRRLVWACVLWLLCAPVLAALGLVVGMAALAAFSGKQSIGVTVKLTDWSAGWLFGPPVILVAAWIVARSRQPQSTEHQS